MGGRGTGSSILGGMTGGVGITERGKVEWRTVVADFNPNAGHREVDYRQTLEDFADVSKKTGKGECEFLGVMDDGGYIVKVAQGSKGHCTYSDEMRADMAGHDVTHYHNRVEATPQQIQEYEDNVNNWRTVARAYKRFETANNRINGYVDKNGQHIKGANERLGDANRQIRLLGGNPNDNNPPANASPQLRQAFADKQDAWHEYELAQRQKVRAEQDFRDRYKAYKGEEAPTKSSQFRIPLLKECTIDETGFIGGCFSAADIDSNLVARDIPTFNASCDEGIYTIKLNKTTTDDQLFEARARIRQLFDTNSRTSTAEAKAFQRKLRGIDRKTYNEGKKNGWSKQQIIATSSNRQLAYLWSEEKRILGLFNISATFRANKNFKPRWEY